MDIKRFSASENCTEHRWPRTFIETCTLFCVELRWH